MRLLHERDQHCRYPGCTARVFLHAHHIVHREHGGPTIISNLILLCSFHHRLVHEVGWPDGRAPALVPIGLRPVAGPTAPALTRCTRGGRRAIPPEAGATSLWRGSGRAGKPPVRTEADGLVHPRPSDRAPAHRSGGPGAQRAGVADSLPARLRRGPLVRARPLRRRPRGSDSPLVLRGQRCGDRSDGSCRRGMDRHRASPATTARLAHHQSCPASTLGHRPHRRRSRRCHRDRVEVLVGQARPRPSQAP